MSKYVSVWNEIKRTGRAEITVSKEASRRILNGIKKAKAAENVVARQAGLVGWSKLVITEKNLSETHVKITMELLYSTRL